MILSNGAGRWRLLAGACLLACMASLAGCSSLARDSEAGLDSAAAGQNETEARRRARIRLELAVNYLQHGQPQVALEEVRQALAADPDNADAYHVRGLAHMAQGDLAKAEHSLRRAQDMKPRDPDILHNLGWLQCQREHYEQAGELFERALAIPGYASRSKTLMSLGVCQQRAGQVEQAEQTLLRAYEIDAGNPVIGYHLASIIFARGDIGRAQFYARRVNNGEFGSAESLWLGIRIERALGDTVAMRQLAEQLRKRFPDSRQVRALDKGNFDE